MKAAFLPDRGVVKVSGEDARNFLNGLVTTDVTQVRPGQSRFGALLTPQGKIVVDFLITEAPAGHGGGFLLDVSRALAQGLLVLVGPAAVVQARRAGEERHPVRRSAACAWTRRCAPSP